MDNKTYTLLKLKAPENDGPDIVVFGEFDDKGAAHRAFAAALRGLAPGEILQVFDDAGTLWWSHEQPPSTDD